MALAFSCVGNVGVNLFRATQCAPGHLSFSRSQFFKRLPIRRLGQISKSYQSNPLKACYHTSSDDTIFALSSGSLATVSGVAVIRVSGKHAHWAASQLIKSPASLPPPRRASFRVLVDPLTGSPLDQAIVISFSNPASFTGEDVAELHVHGSRAVVRAVLQALSSIGDDSRRIRNATAGEFTRRAFENGRLDLTAVEGLADLLAANTDRQRIQALSALGGSTQKVVSEWRAEAVQCLAHAEAALDFSDDVDGSTFDAIIPRVRSLGNQIAQRLKRDGRSGEIVRTGARVVIAGPPNVGKSTLINALAQRPVAIVSDSPGTTRDLLSVSLDLKGISVTVSDTAGIRDLPTDLVEAEGIRRARDAVKEAHVAVVMHDATKLEGNFVMSPTPERMIHVANKVDLLNESERTRVPVDMHHLTLMENGNSEVDCGLDGLVDKLCSAVEEYVGGNQKERGEHTETALVTRLRHREHLQRAVRGMERFVRMREGSSSENAPMDLAAEELRLACREIGSVIGEVHVEEVLDVVFSEFCIGK